MWWLSRQTPGTPVLFAMRQQLAKAEAVQHAIGRHPAFARHDNAPGGVAWISNHRTLPGHPRPEPDQFPDQVGGTSISLNCTRVVPALAKIDC
jgi:hypothetical protein